MISTVLDERRLPSLRGTLAIAHCRYSTTGSTIWENAQPTYRQGPRRAIAIGHNGNLVNTRELLDAAARRPVAPARLDRHGAPDRAARRRARRGHGRRRSLQVLPRVRGAFSLVILDQQRVIGVRDPHGFRPLVLGRLPASARAAAARTTARSVDDEAQPGWCLSSETASLDIVGRRVRPRRRARRDRRSSSRAGHRAPCATPRPNPKLCVFELIYFARPDSYMEGRNLYEVRRRMGEQLAIEHADRRRPRHAGPRHRRPGRGRLRRGERPAVPRGDVPQPLRRADVHPAVGRAAPPGRDDQAQPAARGRRRQAADRRRRLDRARHDDQADRRAAAQGRRHARSTSGSARRRSTTRASTASTRRSRPS